MRRREEKGVGTAFGYHGNKVLGGDSDTTLLTKKYFSALIQAEIYDIRQTPICYMSLVLASTKSFGL